MLPDGRRQIALLPGAGADPAEADRRHLAAHLADEGSGGRARGARPAGDLRQQHADVVAGVRSPLARDARRREDALRRPRAVRLRENRRASSRRRRVAPRRGRSALHQRVGTRFPAELSAHRERAREAGLAADRGAHGNGDAARAHRHRRAAQARIADDDHHRIRPEEPELPRSADAQRPGEGRRAGPATAHERGARRRVRVDAQGGGANRHAPRSLARFPPRRTTPVSTTRAVTTCKMRS